jgi:MFS transporter, CP family, cyanate transporter
MTRNNLGRPAFLLWICGAGLRLSLLAVPPVISLIQRDLHLSGTQIGILSGLPVILFAIMATPGSLLIARIGVLWTLVGGLLITAAGSALRATISSAAELYASTALMSIGIAILQPTMAAAVRQWMPGRATFGTAVYTNGLIIGEIVPVASMLPIVLPYFNQSWRWGLAAWSVPLAMIAVTVAVLAPRSPPITATNHSRRWWPDWKSGLNWQIGMILGSTTSTYFAVNAFLPAYLNSVDRADLVSASLTALNSSQIPTSILLLFVADRLQGRRWPYVCFGLLFFVSVTGIVLTTGAAAVVCAGVIGFTCGAALPLAFALSPLLCKDPDDVARTSAAAFAISYGFAMIVSLLGGVAWDISGVAGFAFLPIAIGALPIMLLASTIPFKR